LNRLTRQTIPTINMKHFFMNILCIESFCPQKRITERCSSVLHSSSTVANLTTKTSLWTCFARLLPRLSWSWAVLLPSDTHRKPITPITAVLLPFVTYLLTLSYVKQMHWDLFEACMTAWSVSIEENHERPQVKCPAGTDIRNEFS
jgi:hypothetical protein